MFLKSSNSFISTNSLLSKSVRFLYQNWRDRVDYLVTNIIFIVKDFLFGKDGGIKSNSSPQTRRKGRKERLKMLNEIRIWEVFPFPQVHVGVGLRKLLLTFPP